MGQTQNFDVFARAYKAPERQKDWDEIAGDVASFHPLGDDVVVAMGEEIYQDYVSDALAMFGRRTPQQGMPSDQFLLRGARVVASNDLEVDEVLVYHLPKVGSVVGLIRSLEEGPVEARPWKRLKKPKKQD